MRCIVTAGPTFEPLDQVRRLTNFSTGKLGTLLARFLAEQGDDVLLLRGETAVFSEDVAGGKIQTFGTSADLASKLKAQSGDSVNAVFHAAAVGDFRFGKILTRAENGFAAVAAGKIPTHELASGSYYVELLPTTKIISSLREWFPTAWIAGWKYEVDGDASSVIQKARDQIHANRSDACVVNGPAYGNGFGLLRDEAELLRISNIDELCRALRAAALARC